jgi:hypothetical protein
METDGVGEWSGCPSRLWLFLNGCSRLSIFNEVLEEFEDSESLDLSYKYPETPSCRPFATHEISYEIVSVMKKILNVRAIRDNILPGPDEDKEESNPSSE